LVAKPTAVMLNTNYGRIAHAGTGNTGEKGLTARWGTKKKKNIKPKKRLVVRGRSRK